MPLDFVLFVAVVLLFYQFGLRYVLTYRLTDKAVQAVLFRVIPVSSTRYEDVEEIRHVSFWEALLYAHAWKASNKLLTGPIVLIHRRRHLPVLITPDEADEFVHKVRHRVHQQTGT